MGISIFQMPCRCVYNGREYEPFEDIYVEASDVESVKDSGGVFVRELEHEVGEDVQEEKVIKGKKRGK